MKAIVVAWQIQRSAGPGSRREYSGVEQLPAKHSFFRCSDSIVDFLSGVTWRDVLGAVPVIRFYMNDEHPLNHRLIAWHAYALQPVLGSVALENFDPPEDLEPCLGRVVDKDQRHAVVGQQVAGADVLFVAPKISEGQGASVEIGRA